MTTRGEKIRKALDEQYEDLLVADGFDEAIIGVGRRCGQPDVVVYSIPRMVAILEGQGMTHDDAVEFLDFNTIGAWVGEKTPVYVETEFLDGL